MGDVKKISVDQNAPVIGTFSGYTNSGFWKILQWEAGTTEGGSSGAPLFDQNKRVVGTLTGGEAVCGRSVNDYFARLSFSYDLSPVLWQQLKGWIDPAQSGVKILNGRDPYAPNFLNVDTLSNIGASEQHLITPYNIPGKGYTTGYNSDSLVMYAEYFTCAPGVELLELLINVGDVSTVLSADSARVYLFSDGPSPGSIIISEKIMLRDAKDNFTLKVDFKNPVTLPGNFYAGWKFWYADRAASETRQFAVKHSPARANPLLNTAWFNRGNQWKPFTQHPYSPLALSIDVKAVVVQNSQPASVNNLTITPRQFRVFPLPAKNTLTLSSSRNLNNINVDIFDFNSRLVKTITFISGFPGIEQIDISDILPGIYFLRINASGLNEIHKIIKIR
jgi:hypothetical protein